MSDWNQFLRWAKRFADETDLEGEERDFKIATADTIRAACAAATSGSPGWEDQLGRALTSSNLMAWQFVDDIRKAIEASPVAVGKAVGVLGNERATVADVSAFTSKIAEAGLIATPGNLTSFASILLMGQRPQMFPPYRASFATDWAKIMGHEPGNTPTERYAGMLSLCDEFLGRASEVGLHLQDRLDAQGLAWTVFKTGPSLRWTPLDRARVTALRAGADPDAAVVERGSGRAPAAEAGAWLTLGAGLRGEGSAFEPSIATWTSDNGEALRALISHDPAGGSVGFVAKFEMQLKRAPDPVILLAAELTYLRFAPLVNVTPETKVQRVRLVLSWASGSYDLSPELEAGLRAPGAFNGGRGYNSQAPSHFQWLCRFVSHWAGTSPNTQAEALRDPFAFLAITESTPHDMPNIRHTIEYLAWPGVFPSVISADHRVKIHTKLLKDLGQPSGSDENSRTRDLVALWAHHRDKATGFADWYHSPYVHLWSDAPDTPRAWLVRPSSGGAPLISRWVAEGFVSLKAEMLGRVPEGASESEVRMAVKAGYMHLDASQQEATTQAHHRFLSVMKPEDIVVTLDHDTVYVGLVVGGAEYSATEDSRLRRAVSWSAQPIPIADLLAPVPSLLDQQGTVVDMTSAYSELVGLVEVDPEIPDLPEVEPPPTRPAPTLPTVSNELAKLLYMDRGSLQEIVDLIQARQQVVLYGPPGTGKTYVAKALAKHLVADPSRVRIVQFHPSYAYEDFFEGYRPTTITSTSEGGVETSTPTFELRPGPLRQLASDCELPENRGVAHFLIIDEMNRANLAKVFGELYFLLEYRDESVQLQYQQANSPPFHLPLNLFIIGTMNTADRSIALVDSAIRRRFPFYEMHPSHEPVKSVLGGYLKARGLSNERAELLSALNESIGANGRDLHIGPSYFMRPDVDAPLGIDRVWRYDILPLLEEHFYGQLERQALHDKFGLPAMKAAVAKAAAQRAADNVATVGGVADIEGSGPGGVDGVTTIDLNLEGDADGDGALS